MIIDARTLSDGASLVADVCIAGAGAAGITLARELRGKGLSVLLLESGGYDTDDEALRKQIQDLYRGEMTGMRTWFPDQNRLRMFGGTTHHWGGWCRPLDPLDLEAREGKAGWPLDFDDLVPWYEKAHTTLELGAFDYDARALAGRLGQPLLLPDSEVFEPRMYQFSPPTRFGKKFRQELQDADDVTVYLYANLRSIRLGAGKDTVSHVECRTLDGIGFTVEAGRYVLAMGGLENARVLLASNQDVAGGVANGSDHVGRFFMEHPHYYESIAVLSTDFPSLAFYKRQPVAYTVGGVERTVPVQGALGLPFEVRTELGVKNFTLTLAESSPDGFETGDLPVSTARSVLGSAGEDPRLLVLTCRSEQTALAESRVTLAEDVDPIGMPRISVHWQVADDDTRRLTRALERIGSEFARNGLGRLWCQQKDGRLETWTWPGAHHLGTTRMSDAPEDGVVNADCRTHEVDNLYIAGSSVFPSGGDANPTLTLVALAHRLAEHLAGGPG